jgi:hypothetical protein
MKNIIRIISQRIYKPVSMVYNSCNRAEPVTSPRRYRPIVAGIVRPRIERNVKDKQVNKQRPNKRGRKNDGSVNGCGVDDVAACGGMTSAWTS